MKTNVVTANGVLFGMAITLWLFSVSGILGVPLWVPELICNAAVVSLLVVVLRRARRRSAQ